MKTAETIHCELCQQSGGEVVWDDLHCRVVLVGGPEGKAFPGFCRVIWREHVREMGDLLRYQREHIMKIVFVTEIALRRLMRPDKINLASLGNMTPHLHWHVIPRWQDDSHFPAPIWAAARREEPRRVRPERDVMHAAMAAALLEFFDANSSPVPPR